MLVRHYIRERLAAYYAQPCNTVVGYYNGTNIDFSRLWGEYHFRQVYRKLYKARKGQWMTPVELFKPHYSYCFADYIASDLLQHQQHHPYDRIEIIELGPGRGTNANAFMTQWQNKYPELYDKLVFIAVDSSPSLHEHQKEVVGSGSHGHKVQVKRVDLMDVAEKRVELVDKSNVPTYVVAFEVLDNLPHDKIIRVPSSKSTNKFSILQTQIIQRHQGQNTSISTTTTAAANELKQHDYKNMQDTTTFDLEETFVELSDPLLQSIVDTVPATFVAMTSASTAQWIPTVACGIISHLFQNRTNMHLLLADFDWLPPTTSNNAAAGSPLITCMNDIDYNCYLNSPYLSDILFPTDFNFLAKYIRATIIAAEAERKHKDNNNNSKTHPITHISILKQGDFLNKFGETHVKATKSWLTGYSPLLGEFANCSVLTASNNNS